MTAPKRDAKSSECLFCGIVLGTRPAHVVLERASVIAFLDVRPLFPGHTLVVPRVHRANLTEVPTQELGELFVAARDLSAAFESVLGADGAFVAVNHKVSQSVPHVHVHAVPRRRGDGLRGFFWPRHAYASESEAAEMARRIAGQFLSEQ